jgi:hypothetical protein
LLKSRGELRGGNHIVDEHNWPIAVSVELCSQFVLGTCSTFTFRFPFSSQHFSVNCMVEYYLITCEENRVPDLIKDRSHPSHIKAPIPQLLDSTVVNNAKDKFLQVIGQGVTCLYWQC